MPGKQSESQGKQLGYTYSIEDIERLKKQPGVVDVTPDMIIFDLAFKQELYHEWVESPCVETIRRSFIKRGADVDAFSPKFFSDSIVIFTELADQSTGRFNLGNLNPAYKLRRRKQ